MPGLVPPRLCVELVVGAVGGDEGRHALEVDKAERCTGLRHLPIRPHTHTQHCQSRSRRGVDGNDAGRRPSLGRVAQVDSSAPISCSKCPVVVSLGVQRSSCKEELLVAARTLQPVDDHEKKRIKRPFFALGVISRRPTSPSRIWHPSLRCSPSLRPQQGCCPGDQ
jgi:hypothetical protein